MRKILSDLGDHVESISRELYGGCFLPLLLAFHGLLLLLL
jgi:hypothetical protein